MKRYRFIKDGESIPVGTTFVEIKNKKEHYYKATFPKDTSLLEIIRLSGDTNVLLAMMSAKAVENNPEYFKEIK